MKIIIAALLGIATSVGGYFGYQTLQSEPVVGGFSDPFISLQLAPSPSNGQVLYTDGTDNYWDAAGAGSSLWTDAGSYVFPKGGDYAAAPYFHATSSTASIFAGGFVSQASTTITGKLTLYDDLVMQHDTYAILHGIKGDASDGFQIQSNSGSIVGTFGAGGGQNVTFPAYTSALLQTNGSGAVAEYAGTSCTNQFVRALSALGIATCESVVTADITDGTIIEPDLDVDDSPSDGDILTYDTTGTNFVWETILDLVNTITGAVNWGGITSFEIPNGTNPTVDADGEVAVDTTQDQFITYDGAEVDVLFREIPRAFGRIGSTSLDYQLSSFDTGTSTWSAGESEWAGEVVTIRAKTNAGTCLVRVGDGTNWTETVTANSSGASDTSLSNGTFTAFEEVLLQIGSCATSPNYVIPTIMWKETRQ